MPQLRASIPPIDPSRPGVRPLATRSARRSTTCEFTLLLTIGLVVMVIFLFLRKLWATIIPSVAVPLSLVGTFGVMYVLGYSLDNLSLMGLTIAVGFVVDDAIVMIENIVRYIEQGDTPFDAALKGAGQIGFTIISITVLAGRRVHPAAVHGRHRRPAVPRVRHDGDDRGAGLGASSR